MSAFSKLFIGTGLASLGAVLAVACYGDAWINFTEKRAIVDALGIFAGIGLIFAGIQPIRHYLDSVPQAIGGRWCMPAVVLGVLSFVAFLGLSDATRDLGILMRLPALVAICMFCASFMVQLEYENRVTAAPAR